MAEEVGSAAGKTVTMAALKSFMNPSLDIIKTIPQGIIELALRGSAAVLALLALISAAACQTAVSNSILTNSIGPVPRSQTFAAGGWIIFISFWVMLYQLLAILQLFLRVKIVYTLVPVVNWSLFFLVDIIAIAIAAGGYFCGAIPLAVYAGRYDDFNGQQNLNSAPVASSASAASAFSFFSMFLFIGMIVYFFAARFFLKWTTHGEKTSHSAESAPDGGDADDE